MLAQAMLKYPAVLFGHALPIFAFATNLPRSFSFELPAVVATLGFP